RSIGEAGDTAREENGAKSSVPSADLPDEAFGHYLAGLIDGEGSFCIYVRDGNCQVSFRIFMRDDDLPILEEIRTRTGIGEIRRQSDRSSHGVVRRPQAVWVVLTRSDTAKLVRILEAYPLRAKKRRDFEIWRRAVRIAGALKPGDMRSWQRQTAKFQLRQLERELKEAHRYHPEGVEMLEPIVMEPTLSLFDA
ncbi:MAG: LAGLIDADG family homing endonuclease, partial [Acetobacteraceae bacterium]|nr:LAGLIDADG family homing endonuclease [Acetobacteraceae bacterium]